MTLLSVSEMIASLTPKLLDPVRKILSSRSFTDEQIQKIIRCLRPEQVEQPKLLAETIDAWNLSMRSGSIREEFDLNTDSIPATASPPPDSGPLLSKINMNTILADVEPDLLLFQPSKLIQRHNNIQGLGLVKNITELWTVLFNAPRGFYLQDWFELSRKIYYIDTKVIHLLYDKKEQKGMTKHPLITSAAVVEADFDHIRTRYLFAHRTGYRELSHMFKIQTALSRPRIKDLILVGDAEFLETFAPFCSTEDYSSFANLIKNHEVDEDDADVCNQLAELNGIRHKKPVNINKNVESDDWP